VRSRGLAPALALAVALVAGAGWLLTHLLLDPPPVAPPSPPGDPSPRPCRVRVAVNKAGVPLPDAEVELLGAGLPLRRLSARTDALGVAGFEVPPGVYHPTGALPSFGLVQADRIRCQGQGEQLQGNLAFFDGRTRVRLRVTDAAGAPAADALVTTRRERGEKQRGASALHATGPDGRLELWLPLDATAYDLTVEAAGHLPATRAVLDGRPEQEVEIALERAAEIRPGALEADERTPPP